MKVLFALYVYLGCFDSLFGMFAQNKKTNRGQIIYNADLYVKK